MKTEDLIAALAATSEPVPAKAQARRRILPPLLVGTAIAFVLASLWLGLAPMDVAAIQPGFWLKLGYSAALGGLGLVLAARLARPGARVDLVLTGGAVALVALILMVGAMQLVNLAPQDRMPMMMGASWKLCPWLITAVAAPIYLAMALGLRGLAPTRPALAGGAAGLAAGGIGAALYALHCPEYAPAFIAVWYTAGIVVSAVLGAVVGSRLLRW
jgi:hypothetical protein